MMMITCLLCLDLNPPKIGSSWVTESETRESVSPVRSQIMMFN